MKKQEIAVIGLGTFGFELAVQLARHGHDVLAIDIDEKKVNAIKDMVPVAVAADVSDEDVLKKLELDKFDKIIFGMSSELETIILAITHLKKMNAKYIIGKANTRIKKEILLKLGVDEVILPEISTAIRLAEKISYPSLKEKLHIDLKHALFEVKVPPQFVGKSLKELNLRHKYGINVILRKNQEGTQMITSPDIRLQQGDEILVIGEEKNIYKLFNT